ncbi:hypothetical protein [Enterococcus faecium]|uniref:hypothetical protein n=1 Tax=Enterococcus faecium TaxID=1352 RepID=UPI000BF146D4|nr:hypothetical protein [Enterococcus faecium]PEH48066.1 hypothetical protein CRM75_09265 [Enterococcus faecium]PEH48118.1 hypothetical protein CRM75_09570 [Enterococcus faecium]
MKKIWQYGRTGGKELEVSDDFPIQVPFTDVPPLEEIELEDQFFIPSENRWKEIINGLDREKLDNLDSLFGVLEKQNTVLENRANSHSTQLTEAQLALTEIYEEMIGGISE